MELYTGSLDRFFRLRRQKPIHYIAHEAIRAHRRFDIAGSAAITEEPAFGVECRLAAASDIETPLASVKFRP
jgi:hypothetical protein